MCATEWLPPEYAAYRKHLPPGGRTPWTEIVKRTGSGRKIARFHRELTAAQIERLQMAIVTHPMVTGDPRSESEARFIVERNKKRVFYLNSPTVIGASLGQETTIVRIEWLASGPVHGYPVTRDELTAELRAHNPDELKRFLEE